MEKTLTTPPTTLQLMAGEDHEALSRLMAHLAEEAIENTDIDGPGIEHTVECFADELEEALRTLVDAMLQEKAGYRTEQTRRTIENLGLPEEA